MFCPCVTEIFNALKPLITKVRRGFSKKFIRVSRSYLKILLTTYIVVHIAIDCGFQYLYEKHAITANLHCNKYNERHV